MKKTAQKGGEEWIYNEYNLIKQLIKVDKIMT